MQDDVDSEKPYVDFDTYQRTSSNPSVDVNSIRIFDMLTIPITVNEFGTSGDSPLRAVYGNDAYIKLMGDSDLHEYLKRRQSTVFNGMSASWLRNLKGIWRKCKDTGRPTILKNARFYPGGQHALKRQLFLTMSMSTLSIRGSDTYIITELLPESPVSETIVQRDKTLAVDGVVLADTLFSGVDMISGGTSDVAMMNSLDDFKVFDVLHSPIVVLGYDSDRNSLTVEFANYSQWNMLRDSSEKTHNARLEEFLAELEEFKIELFVNRFIRGHSSKGRVTWPRSDGSHIQVNVKTKPVTVATSEGDGFTSMVLIHTAYIPPRHQVSKAAIPVLGCGNDGEVDIITANMLRNVAVQGSRPTMLFNKDGTLLFINERGKDWIQRTVQMDHAQCTLYDIFPTKACLLKIKSSVVKRKQDVELVSPLPHDFNKQFHCKASYAWDVAGQGDDAILTTIFDIDIDENSYL